MGIGISAVHNIHKMFPAGLQCTTDNAENLLILNIIFQIPNRTVRHVQHHIKLLFIGNLPDITAEKTSV